MGLWAGLLAIAAGLLLALDGVWTAAVPVLLVAGTVTWLVGAWAPPATRDAYILRVDRILRDWTADTNLAYGRLENRQAQFTDRVANLSPPAGLAVEHEALVRHLHAYDRLRGQPRTPTCTGEVTEVWRAIRNAKDDLSRSAASEQQLAYAAALERLFKDRRDEYLTAAAASERATSDAARKLASVKPPTSVAAEHQALTATIQAHLEVARAFHEAAQAGDAQRTAKALTRWQTSLTHVRDEYLRVADRLDVNARWPTPASRPESDD